MSFSHLANTLQPSEILKLADEIRAMRARGEQVFNFTIGDFDPQLFPVPEAFKQAIAAAYTANATNYPPANGIPELRQAISAHVQRLQGLEYHPDEILVSSGARPLVFGAFTALVDRGEKVVYPAPSWNNNHYTHLVGGEKVMVPTKRENGFLPTAAELAPHLADAGLLALCSPLNPTGTVFSPNQLAEICDLVLAENTRRGPGAKPLYVIYDQIYSALTYGDSIHTDPVSLRPEMRPYTIFIDGMSKAFAATGVRVGWGFGPEPVIRKMRAILSHVGSWAPRPEQSGAAAFLSQTREVDAYLNDIREGLNARLDAVYQVFMKLRSMGLPVDAIEPQGALYLTIQLDLIGKTTPEGEVLANARDVYSYILREAKFAVVPFYAFGLDDQSPWFRLSVGTVAMDEIPAIADALATALLPFTEPVKA